jgi:hypothetical protein
MNDSLTFPTIRAGLGLRVTRSERIFCKKGLAEILLDRLIEGSLDPETAAVAQKSEANLAFCRNLVHHRGVVQGTQWPLCGSEEVE